jgi:hypothetical protein
MISKKTSVLVMFVIVVGVVVGLTIAFRREQKSTAVPQAPAAPRNFVVLDPAADAAAIVRRAATVAPSPAQAAWQEREFIAFTHFGMNTFTDREWGQGTEDPRLFNPSDFDARQWVRALKEGGMKMVIVTAKHHDGFCLWPSALTTHSVKSSPWKDGKGDVVAEVAAACREAGLAFGVYLSPWDRHEPSYGDSPRYNEHFRGQLRELLTNYGPIAEVWFDGANGEGPNGKRQVYDWPSYYKVIRELQPQAVIFGMAPDLRWVGTESGYGRETEWSVVPVDAPPAGAVLSPAYPLDGFFLPKDLTGEAGFGQGPGLVSRGDGRLHPARLVLSCQGGRPGQDAGEAGRHLFLFRRPERRSPSQRPSGQARPDHRLRRRGSARDAPHLGRDVPNRFCRWGQGQGLERGSRSPRRHGGRYRSRDALAACGGRSGLD